MYMWFAERESDVTLMWSDSQVSAAVSATACLLATLVHRLRGRSSTRPLSAPVGDGHAHAIMVVVYFVPIPRVLGFIQPAPSLGPWRYSRRFVERAPLRTVNGGCCWYCNRDSNADWSLQFLKLCLWTRWRTDYGLSHSRSIAAANADEWKSTSRPKRRTCRDCQWIWINPFVVIGLTLKLYLSPCSEIK